MKKPHPEADLATYVRAIIAAGFTPYAVDTGGDADEVTLTLEAMVLEATLVDDAILWFTSSLGTTHWAQVVFDNSPAEMISDYSASTLDWGPGFEFSIAIEKTQATFEEPAEEAPKQIETQAGIVAAARIAIPQVALSTLWEPDEDARFDEHGMTKPGSCFYQEDPEDWQAWQSEVRAVCIFDGRLHKGAAFLGGSWYRDEDEPQTSDPEIGGYYPQMVCEALEELAAYEGNPHSAAILEFVRMITDEKKGEKSLEQVLQKPLTALEAL